MSSDGLLSFPFEEVEEEEEIKNCPEDVKFRNPMFDFDFHKSSNVFAVSSVSGAIQLWNYSVEQTFCVTALKEHTDSCRTITFADTKLYTGSKDKSINILDLETEEVVVRYRDAHEHGISKLIAYKENLFVSGDDEGYIKLWDIRTDDKEKHAFEHEHFDYISDFALTKYRLFATR
eukprot:TRINITY_DN1389_c0_g2_i1.p1 TRINITY_DN1389_c0_g2~~TRINITY_DN1389_c0_g2_i1.p1  ORF type:complete len:176 (-),score=52.89 TRINITY_DN1389_c0_g2_i1:47-574(-)